MIPLLALCLTAPLEFGLQPLPEDSPYREEGFANLEHRLEVEWGFPGRASGKESACQCRRHKRHWFNSWVGKIP